MSFVHLHLHSQYSLLESTIKPKNLAQVTQNMGMKAVAITDNGNMFGAMEFYFACKDQGVKPILGLDAYIAPKTRLIKGEDRESMQMPNRRLVLLAKNHEGYQELCRISTIGFQEGFYYKPRIDYDVLKKYSQNLIVLTGGLRGEVTFQFLDKGEDAAVLKLKELKELFGERLYLEMQRTGVADWDKVNPFLQELSEKYHVPLVATNDVHYLNREDAFAQEVLMCVASNKTLQDENRPRLGSQEYYFKTPDQMKKLFRDLPQAIENTLKIADQIDVKFKFKDEKGRMIYHLPEYPAKEGRTSTEEIERIAEEGLQQRVVESLKTAHPITDEKKPIYQDRLQKELKIIDHMGFNGYFLIVQDFINWAKSNGIPVGPGRGSGAGSLVAYSLRITDVDPMPYNLIFERFLNPERISMPDFDIDFCQDRRGEVIHYVTEKYGAESVSQIITFGKLQAKAALRDVGRVLGMTFQEVDVIAKLIPDVLNIELKKAIEMEPRLTELADQDPKIATLLDLAQRVEGLTRHASIHAAGVVISDQPIVQLAPLYRGTEDENVVQFDMKIAEKIGLIKFDFLGLKTLTLISDALRLIEKNRNVKLAAHEINIHDKGIYELMSRGDTKGVFQFESDGMTEFIKKAKPSNFEDITAINALFRPGPMQFIDEYANRKHGKVEIKYLFPELESIIKETYGIIVYQEHVQLIAARIANYSLGEADILRRAMGKKDPVEMAKQKSRFLEGAKANGYNETLSGELFDQMAKFAEYGFNKSHAAAYCVVAAQTAWLKNYYPVEFFAAMLSTEMSDTDKVVEYIKDAHQHKIKNHKMKVLAPHVNVSERKFTVKDDDIYFGLGAIKGVGDSAIEAILEAREKMPDQKFHSLEDFFNFVDLRRVNKKVVESLIKAGALDLFGATRAQLMAIYPTFIDRAEGVRKDRDMGQTSLFDMSEEKEAIILPKISPFTKMQLLAYEKEVLGFYLSDHPLSGMQGVMKPFINSTIVGLEKIPVKHKVTIGGSLAEPRELITKKGTRMAFSQLEDMESRVELVIFPNAYEKVKDILKTEQPVLVEGVLEKSESGACKILVDNIVLLSEKVKVARGMRIRLVQPMMDQLDKIKTVMESNPGQTNVFFEIDLPDRGKKVMLDMPDLKGVQVSHDLLEQIHSVCGTTEFIFLQ